MSDADLDALLLQVARNVRRAKDYLARGAEADARRHTARARSLLTVLANARLVRAAAELTSQPTARPALQPIASSS